MFFTIISSANMFNKVIENKNIFIMYYIYKEHNSISSKKDVQTPKYGYYNTIPSRISCKFTLSL